MTQFPILLEAALRHWHGVENDSEKAGELAGGKLTCGEHHRFSIAPVHTRFGELQWFVWDAEKSDPESGLATVICQGDSFDEAYLALLEALNDQKVDGGH